MATGQKSDTKMATERQVKMVTHENDKSENDNKSNYKHEWVCVHLGDVSKPLLDVRTIRFLIRF